MKIDDVIDDLVKDLQPVRPVRSFAVRMAVWVGAAFAAVGAMLLAISARRSVDLILGSTRLIVDVILVVFIAVTASWGALKMSVPGEERPWIHKYVPVALLGFWFLFSAGQVASELIQRGAQALIPDPHLICAALVLGAGGLLLLPIGILIRAAAPLDPRWCGALAGIAAGAAAMVGIEFICVYDRPIHFATYHVAPVLFYAATGAFAAPKLLKPRP